MNEKLLLEIRRQGLHQYEVAGQAGISETTLSKIIWGRTRPAERIKIRLARVLDLPIEELFEKPKERN